MTEVTKLPSLSIEELEARVEFTALAAQEFSMEEVAAFEAAGPGVLIKCGCAYPF